MKPSLSVLILVQNRADRISRLLACASTFADEVVLVDGGSTDNTPEVAARFPKVRLVSRTFDGNFAKQRNFAINQARGEWVFFIDSDELPGPNLVRILPWLMASRFTSFKVPTYWLVREDPTEYVESSLHYPDRHLRLFRRDSELRFDESQAIHEIIPKEKRGALFPLNFAHLLHYSFIWMDRAAREAKVKRYDELRPGVMRINQMYLYEDMPHVVKPCRESWRGTEPVFRSGDALRERIRLYLPRL